MLCWFTQDSHSQVSQGVFPQVEPGQGLASAQDRCKVRTARRCEAAVDQPSTEIAKCHHTSLTLSAMGRGSTCPVAPLVQSPHRKSVYKIYINCICFSACVIASQNLLSPWQCIFQLTTLICAVVNVQDGPKIYIVASFKCTIQSIQYIHTAVHPSPLVIPRTFSSSGIETLSWLNSNSHPVPTPLQPLHHPPLPVSVKLTPLVPSSM